MICPKCHGKGIRQDHRAPCDYEGCHAGQVDCCDGIQAIPSKKPMDMTRSLIRLRHVVLQPWDITALAKKEQMVKRMSKEEIRRLYGDGVGW